jgi:hypothetical protein
MTFMFDCAQCKTDHSQRHKPECHRLAIQTEERKCGDRDDGKRAQGDPQECGFADLERVSRRAHQEARRSEERGFQDEIHQPAADHLREYQDANDSTRRDRGHHSRLLAV